MGAENLGRAGEDGGGRRGRPLLGDTAKKAEVHVRLDVDEFKRLEWMRGTDSRASWLRKAMVFAEWMPAGWAPGDPVEALSSSVASSQHCPGCMCGENGQDGVERFVEAP